jgi:hypothetical protein
MFDRTGIPSTTLFLLLAAGTARAGATLTLQAPEQALAPGEVYTFIPRIEGTSSRQVHWQFREDGHPMAEDRVRAVVRALPEDGGVVFRAPRVKQVHTFRLLATSAADAQASAEIMVQVEPRMRRPRFPGPGTGEGSPAPGTWPPAPMAPSPSRTGPPSGPSGRMANSRPWPG